jgi:hypothetical protein
MELDLFDEVGEVLRGIVPQDLGLLRQRAHRSGIKAWFGPEKATREHYEAQLIRPDSVKGAKLLAVEVGFHAEHPQVTANDEVIARLLRHEKRWRRALGNEATVGPFLGRADVWRRVSETWPDPDIDDPDLALELATRLADYITALEPLRHGR